MLRSEPSLHRHTSYDRNVIALLFVVAVAVLMPAAGVRAQQPDIFPDPDDFARQFERDQQGERAKLADLCRKHAETAEEAIQATEAKRDEVAASLEEALSANSTARQQATAAAKETQTARRTQREREDALLAEQGPETPYGMAQTELQQARDDVDRVIRDTLGLPERTTPATEQQRATERARFTSTQKARLKDSTEYGEANDRVSAAVRHVADLKQQLLEADDEYQAANERVAAAVEAEDAADAAAKATSLELKRVRQELKKSETSLAGYRRVLAQVNSVLANLGMPRVKK